MEDSEMTDPEPEGWSYAESEDADDVYNFALSTANLLLEKVIPDKRKALTLKKAGECLRILGKIWNLSEYPPVNYPGEILCNNAEKLMDMEGYVDEYQYLHLEAVDLNLTDVKVIPKYFVWLLSVDLSGNLLTNEGACPVTKLANIVALRLNRNKFRDPYMPVMKHLQYLGLNNNKVTSLHRIYHPNLETLDLNYNRIKYVDAADAWKHPKLKQLELRGNKLQTTLGIEYATLVNIYLAENQITKLEGMEVLVNLQRLHLRDNPLSDLSGFSEANSQLKYLNIRKCQVNAVEDVQNLSVLVGLRELIIKGNNFNPEPERQTADENEDNAEDEEDADDEDEDEEESKRTHGDEDDDDDEEENDDREIRIQILMYLPNLKRIDKKPVTKEELESMKEMADDINN